MDVMKTSPEPMKAMKKQTEEGCPVPDPQATPPLTKGANPENDLYEIWKTADENTRPQVESYLLPHLRRHAAKVCWMVLRSHQPHLIDEIAQDTLMDIQSFEGRSAFSTWVHSRALNRVYKERKQRNRRKEISITGLGREEFEAVIPTFDSSILMGELWQKLTPAQRILIDLKVNEGLTDEEIASELGILRNTIQYRWTVLRKKLRKIYNGRHFTK